MSFFDVHTHHLRHSENAIGILALTDLPAVVPSVPFSAGIHPQDCHVRKPDDFVPLWNDKSCCAVGECGLDRRFATEIPLNLQTEIFLAQARFAEKLQKPLLIHCVRCYDEIFRLKKQENPQVPWILHSFRGNEKKTFCALDAGFYLSFGMGLLRDEGNVAPYFSRIPQNRIFFETDDDKDGAIGQVYAVAASLYGISVLELQKIIARNVSEVFGL